MVRRRANRKQKVLFFSAGDATRSRMAEGFFRSYVGDELDAMSSAVSSGDTHPLAPEVMQEASIDIEQQPFESVADTLRDQFTCVISICDETKERYPIFPFSPRFMRWNITAPDADGSRDRMLEHLRHVREETNECVKQFVAETERSGEAAGSSPLFPRTSEAPREQALSARVRSRARTSDDARVVEDAEPQRQSDGQGQVLHYGRR